VFNLIAAAVVLLATVIVLKIFKRIINHSKFAVDATETRRRHSIYLLIKYFILVISVVTTVQALGFEIKLILAGSAALLVGIGLGLQSIFADFLSGIFLLIEGTIKVGEIIEVDGIVGKVHAIHLRNSEVHSRENVVMIIPNSKFVTDKVINWSKNHDSVRFSVKIGVAYGSDARKVKEILQTTMDSMEHIESEPPPYVRFEDFGESSLDFELLFWTKMPFQINDIKSDLRYNIYDELNNNKITIPFPQRDVHIKPS
jgi:small-conductance mechanosensitive channel